MTTYDTFPWVRVRSFTGRHYRGRYFFRNADTLLHLQRRVAWLWWVDLPPTALPFRPAISRPSSSLVQRAADAWETANRFSK